MHLKRLVVASTTACILFPAFASAASITELQAQLQALTAQIATLQAQGVQGGVVAPQSAPAVSSICLNLPRNLSRGSRGSDVAQLQQFLISQNLLAADSATGFFGALTENAVKQWQSRNGIVFAGTPATTGYGAVGPKTRTALANCAPQSGPSTSLPSAIAPSATGGTTGLNNTTTNTNAPATTNTNPTNTTTVPNTATQSPQNQSCTVDGATVANGTSKTFYSRRDVEVGLNCSIVGQNRTCTNGALSGDSSFAYGTCAPRTTKPDITWPTYPNFKVTIQPGNQLSVAIAGFTYPSEITPIILPNPKTSNTSGSEKIVILPGSSSRICVTNANLLSGNVLIPQSSCYINAATGDLFKEDTAGKDVWTDPSLLSSNPWTYSYDGIFTAAVNPTTREIFFGRNFENQSYVNRWVTGARDCSDPTKAWTYQSTILPTTKQYCTCAEQAYQCTANDTSPLCLNGNNICPADLSDPNHIHSWPTFTTGVTMGASSYDGTNGYAPKKITDYGPILWPQQGGYTQAGVNVAYPAVVVKDDYLYLFYQISPPRSGQNGGAYCMGLSRSSLANGGKPGTWQNYVNGGFSANPLPSGFSLSNISSFFTRSGGAADCVSPPSSEAGERPVTNWFSVARVKDTQFYIAVEESALNWGQYQQAIRFSTDLINWSPKQVVDSASSWGQGKYTYGRFLNAAGNTNAEIDSDAFYLYGKNIPNSYRIDSAKLSIIPRPVASRFAAVIDHYYMQLLNRPATTAEISSQSQTMNSGGCPAVIQNITQSSEFASRRAPLSNTEYIKILSQAILSRVLADNDGGLQWYVANLQPGAFNRDSVVAQMSMIPEAVSACGLGITL